MTRAREVKLVSSVDGAIGAFIFTCLTIAILMFLGCILYSFADFDFMELFNSYCYTVADDGTTWSAALFTTIYDCNPLNSVNFIASMQQEIAEFFGH